MRFLIDQSSHEQLKKQQNPTPDCYVRPGEYLHHIYIDGVKYVVARALIESMQEAEARDDQEALHHLKLHKDQLDQLLGRVKKDGSMSRKRLLGDPPPRDDGAPARPQQNFLPPAPDSLEKTGLNRVLIQEMILRTVYNRGQPTGGEIARELQLPYQILGRLLQEMREANLIDIIGQSGLGDATYQYVLKSPRGATAIQDALKKTEYVGPAPVPYEYYLRSIEAQTIKNLVVTRRSIRRAFADLIMSDEDLNEIGPAINSADSIFLFGYPGNGKTSVAERITRLMGDHVYVPYAIEADGQIIKVFDGIVHEPLEEVKPAVTEQPDFGQLNGPSHDLRFIKIKRPVVIVGGELTMPMLDLSYNALGRFYEAPLQMKANLGIFMIDDFGRQQIRAMDLLNRWIVPLEKRFDYLNTVTGKKLQIPFDLMLIFSTNLDPNQLADEAFLRRIKFKIEIRDPDEAQWRQIWHLVCQGKKIPLDQKGIDYLIEKWYRPFERPLRKCQPRDIINQMVSIAKYNMERVTFSPDLIDAACHTYFISEEQKEFGAQVDLR